MRKKTFKTFVNSFIISLFTLWTVNELFAIPQPKASGDIDIPEQNVTFFLQGEGNTAIGSESTPVKTTALSKPVARSVEKDIFIDKSLFILDEDEEGFQIGSVEDAADIPLEYSATTALSSQKAEDVKTQKPNIVIAHKPETIENPVVAVLASPSLDLSSPENKSVKEQDTSSPADLPVVSLANNTQSIISQNVNTETELALIPLEFGHQTSVEKDIIITENAPENQIAMAEGNNFELENIAFKQQTESKEAEEPKKWQEMKEKDIADNPWVVAKGTRNPRNNHVLEEDFYKGLTESEITGILNKPESLAEPEKGTQVAEMVKNILIPIPEDILNDENLTPQLVSPKKSDKNYREEPAIEEQPVSENKKSGGILQSLASMFSGSDEEANDDTLSSNSTEKPSKTKKKKSLFSVFGEDKAPTKILPAEMRLSFQPGRAEISGTTLRWIQAFANKVNEDPRVILEIRIDRTSSFELQQKRLNLLHNILTNKGVDYEKINTVFTSREPNSFIIRTLRINENVNNDIQKKDKRQNLYYRSW